MSQRNNCTPLPLCKWSHFRFLQCMQMKPWSWRRGKHFLASVCIVDDKWWVMLRAGLFSCSPWCLSGTLVCPWLCLCAFLLLTMCMCETETRTHTCAHTHSKGQIDYTIWGLCKCLSDLCWRRLYSSKPPWMTENNPKPTQIRAISLTTTSFVSGQ